MESIGPFLGSIVQINNRKSLTDVLRKVESDAVLAGRISSIVIDDNELEESDLDADGDPLLIAPEVYERYGTEIAELIDTLHKHGGLETFRWTTGSNEKNTRPVAFWESLWKVAATLKHLSIDFTVHELHKLSKIMAPPSIEFRLLETLSIDASAGHGDDGSLIETILRYSTAVRQLVLSLTVCDLEGCRLKGITWQYTFPSLETLDLRTYNSDNTALSEFLVRHPTITTLTWEVDADEGFIFPEKSLPGLQALSMEFHGQEELEKANVDFLAQCKHLSLLRVTRYSYTAYLEIARLRALKCLELEERLQSWREWFKDPNELDDEYRREDDDEDDEDDEDDDEEEARKAADALEAETGYWTHSAIIGGKLKKMQGLQELAVDLSTGNTWYKNKDLVWGHRRPMDVRELIRALRVSDDRGLQLPEETLLDFPEIPQALEYLKWDIGDKGVLYRFKRNGGRVKAVECEAQRKVADGKSWTEKRVLEY